MKLIIRAFHDLTNRQLYEILQLRQIVFVVEQDCPYLDCDDKDQEAYHICLVKDDQLIAYTRVLGPGISYENYASIGRVVNHPKFRKQGFGKSIMKASISFCKDQYPSKSIKISAQCYLDSFYQNLGFVPTGESYLEDGIPHQSMILQ